MLNSKYLGRAKLTLPETEFIVILITLQERGIITIEEVRQYLTD